MPEKDQNQKEQEQKSLNDQKQNRSGAFNEPSRGDEKSTTNVEEESQAEQEQKEAMTERD